MTSATPQDYAWWEEFRDGIGVSGFCFTLVAGMEPAAVLQRLAATSGELMEVPGYIEVGPADGGSVIVDLAGYAGIMRDVVCELSRGTVLATVHNNGGSPRSVDTSCYAASSTLSVVCCS
ncbi:DUF6461 domain-containing protein [Streptosporangium canum]|uniref:DUF6461 domain-containing protein n=1 Tax=Streptosporangium canum TaxID=324952 RepID=UPI00343B1DBC